MLEALLGKAKRNASVGWAKLSTPPIGAKESHAAAAIGTDLYIFGGDATNTLSKYDTLTSTWTTYPQVGPVARSKVAMAALGKKLYVCSGQGYVYATLNDLWCFDTELLTWVQLAAPGYALVSTTLVTFNEKLYAIGGYNNNTTYYSNVREYNPATNTWGNAGYMPVATAMGIAGVLNGNLFYHAGNTTNADTWGTLYTSPTGGTWTKGPDAPYARYLTAGAVVDDTLYVFGGAYPQMTALCSYKVGEGWTLLNPPAPVPSARWGCSLTAIDGKLYLFGGTTGSALNDFWRLTL
jgi:N-acetylneuraminic acid mutarotase